MSNTVKRVVLISSSNKVIQGRAPQEFNGFMYSWRTWQIKMTDEQGSSDLPWIDYVEWKLHPSFKNPVRRGFMINDEGWGEFGIPVTVVFKDKTVPPFEFEYILEFMNPSYTTKQVLTIKNPSPGFVRLLEQDEIRRKSAKQGGAGEGLKKAKPRGPALIMPNGQIDLDALAARLSKLSPTNALTVAQLIKRNAPSDLRVTETPGAFEFDLSECADALIGQIAEVVGGMED
ncbi:hypothetical protein DFJ74DRAFT_67823 [Hyaloraphidium curvatum]|nr:hypothetical protein DFJ74DRAFT_67823 [Hyaloraphidium curvatum]